MERHIFDSVGVGRFLETQPLPKARLNLKELRQLAKSRGIPTSLKEGGLVITIPAPDPKEDKNLQVPTDPGFGFNWGRDYFGTKLTLVPSFYRRPTEAERMGELEFLQALNLNPVEIELPHLIVVVPGCDYEDYTGFGAAPRNPHECMVACFRYELEAYLDGFEERKWYLNIKPPLFSE